MRSQKSPRLLGQSPLKSARNVSDKENPVKKYSHLVEFDKWKLKDANKLKDTRNHRKDSMSGSKKFRSTT